MKLTQKDVKTVEFKIYPEGKNPAGFEIYPEEKNREAVKLTQKDVKTVEFDLSRRKKSGWL